MVVTHYRDLNLIRTSPPIDLGPFLTIICVPYADRLVFCKWKMILLKIWRTQSLAPPNRQAHFPLHRLFLILPRFCSFFSVFGDQIFQDPLDVQPISCYSQIPTPEDSPPSQEQISILPAVFVAPIKTPEPNPLSPEKNPRILKKSVSIVPHTPEKLEEKVHKCCCAVRSEYEHLDQKDVINQFPWCLFCPAARCSDTIPFHLVQITHLFIDFFLKISWHFSRGECFHQNRIDVQLPIQWLTMMRELLSWLLVGK